MPNILDPSTILKLANGFNTNPASSVAFNGLANTGAPDFSVSVEPLQAPQLSQISPVSPDFQGVTNDNSPLYLENVPAPLSSNNPFMAYFPKKGSGLSATRKLISDAMAWENQEAIRKEGLARQDAVTNEQKLNQNRVAAIALKMLSDASGNPDTLSQNRDRFNMYNTILSNPGGEQFAPDIMNSLLGLAGAGNGLSPLDQARINEINARIRLTNTRAAQVGLESNKNDPYFKQVMSMYNAEASKKGGKLSYDAEGNQIWTFPSGTEMPPVLDWARQNMKPADFKRFSTVAFGSDYSLPKDLSLPVKKSPVSYRANSDYSREEWDETYNDVQKLGGPGAALNYYLKFGGTSPQRLVALLDRYNQFLKRKHGDKAKQYKSLKEYKETNAKHIAAVTNPNQNLVSNP